MADRAHDEAMSEAFHRNPAYAVELLTIILEDGDPGELLIALRQIESAFGSLAKAAEGSPF